LAGLPAAIKRWWLRTVCAVGHRAVFAPPITAEAPLSQSMRAPPGDLMAIVDVAFGRIAATIPASAMPRAIAST